VLIAAAWPVGICAGAVWLVVAAIARLSSLAALVSFLLAPLIAALLADAIVVKLALVIAVLVFARHHQNIRRLLAGTEPRIGQKATSA
jgi:acyl phosphate:glycerol-3-phosphate acyltransferase